MAVFGKECTMRTRFTSYGNSDVIKLTPRPTICPTVLCSWNYTMLYSFGAIESDKQVVAGTLLVDSQGNSYGMNQYGGGSCNCGTVFKVDAEGNEITARYAHLAPNTLHSAVELIRVPGHTPEQSIPKSITKTPKKISTGRRTLAASAYK